MTKAAITHNVKQSASSATLKAQIPTFAMSKCAYLKAL